MSLQSSSSLSPIAQSLALRIQSFVLRVLAVANEYCTNLHSVETAEDVAFLRPFQQKSNAVSHLRDLSFGRILTVTLGVILHKVSENIRLFALARNVSAHWYHINYLMLTRKSN